MFLLCDEQSRWLNEIQKSDWGAGQYLYELLRDHRLKDFCTYAEQDDIRESSLTPWVGFVYTFPAFRGNRYMGKLLDYAEVLARGEGHRYIHISTGETGLYEKYGYSFWKTMKDVNGEDSRVYREMV